MALLVILLCLALQRYWQIGLHFSRISWLMTYLNSFRFLWEKSNFWCSLGGMILLLLPLPITAGIIDELLKGWLFNLPQLLFQLGILWFCLNAYGYRTRLQGYFAAALEQQQQNITQQESTLLYNITAIPSNNGPSLHRPVIENILLQAAEQLFGVLFWYLLLGAAGAIGYYAVLLLARSQTADFSEVACFRPAAQQLLGGLVWMPFRIVAFVYALAGDFAMGWHYCKHYILSKPQQNEAFITEAGLAALDKLPSNATNDEILQTTVQLINRTLFIVVILLAIFTLGGWFK
jgi:membrane protein required for beta-lactamase induction